MGRCSLGKLAHDVSRSETSDDEDALAPRAEVAQEGHQRALAAGSSDAVVVR
jgi:hypothetical protein